MQTSNIQRQSIILAAITSPILAGMMVTPIFIVSNMPMDWFPYALGGGTMMQALVWTFNITLDKLIKGRNALRYAISYTVIIIVVFVVRMTIKAPMPLQFIPIPISVLMATFINSIILVLYELLKLRYAYWRTAQENAELKISQIESQFQLLKNQLKPHFLFNALSTLKTLIKRQPQQAEQYLVQLADFLRASLVLDQKKQISIAEDWQIAMNYLKMQMVRFKDSIILDNQLPEKWEAPLYVPPFTLQLLVENAIKHTAFSTEEPLKLSIRIHPKNNHWIEVENNLKPKEIGEDSSRIGLENLSKHLVLLGSQPVQIEKTESYFRVGVKCVERIT